MGKKNEYLIKFVIILLSLFPTVAIIHISDIKLYLIFIFIYSINIRLRKLITNEKFFLTSLILDIIIIYYIYNKFYGLIYLLVLITVIDCIFHLEKYKLGIIVLSSIFFIYIIKDSNILNIALNIFIISTFILLTVIIKEKLKEISQIEYLYDDVRRYSYELEKAKKQVEVYSNRVEELTQTEERNRISNEIHDTVGHRLTGLLFQMEAGIRLINNNDKKGEKLLETSVENLRETIDVLRDTVRKIKPKEHKDVLSSIKELIKRFKRDTQVNVTFIVKGNRVKLYPGAELIIYKNAQEALTNAIRHGKAKNIEIKLIFKERNVVFKVKNDGFVPKVIKRGMGIDGMEERLNFIGGKLNIYNNEEFIVESIVPIRKSNLGG
ncbi:MAG: sensor histidine kinase [Firmicutes bacterium]|nr:sensor histidine kinase [Bacillota bacterium]